MDCDIHVVGADGRRWHVHGPGSADSPVRMLAGDVGDLVDAPLESTYKARVGQAGSSYLAHRWLERNVVLRVHIHGDDWWEAESRFTRGLRPDADAFIEVTTARWGTRRLRVRLAETITGDYELDPHVREGVSKQIVLRAADPWWHGLEHRDEFVFTGTNWAGGSVTVDNPGDVPAWPRWVLTSPAKFGLPDIPIGAEHDQDRMVYLPFQPNGRDVLVDTDPLEEMIVASDGTLMWAQMNGQFFQNPIPPLTPETRLPVYVDPFPLLPIPLPASWRMWIAVKLRQLAELVGADRLLAMTPEEFAAKVTGWLKGKTPEWIDPVNPDLLAELTADVIARLIRETYGRLTNIAGATAQVRVDRRWQRPWG